MAGMAAIHRSAACNDFVVPAFEMRRGWDFMVFDLPEDDPDLPEDDPKSPEELYIGDAYDIGDPYDNSQQALDGANDRSTDVPNPLPRVGRRADHDRLDIESPEHGFVADTVAPEAIAESVKKSLQESISATGEWMIETGLVLTAHCIFPPAGHIVTLVLEAREVFGDAVALADPDGPGELHVPLVHLAPGIGIEAGLQLGEVDEADGPRLSVFVVPGGGGLFGGWALERDTDQEAAGKEATTTEQDIPEVTAVFRVELSQAVDATQDRRKQAAILRETASRQQRELWAMPESADVSLMVLHDEQAGLGMWLKRSAGAGALVDDAGQNSGIPGSGPEPEPPPGRKSPDHLGNVFPLALQQGDQGQGEEED
jgi:hypothetical protein